MAKAAKSAELKKAFLTHRDQTEQHVERLQEVFELIGRRAQAKTCEAIKGILEEGEEIMEEYSGSEALDAGLLAAAQAVEHYEMSRYGTLKTWAAQLGLKNAVSLLDETLQEEKANRRSAERPRGVFRQPGSRLSAGSPCAFAAARGSPPICSKILHRKENDGFQRRSPDRSRGNRLDDKSFRRPDVPGG